jgi:carbamoyl-phosphate synthase large subunit
MAIGRTFTESIQKACRSLETGRLGLNADPAESAYEGMELHELVRHAAIATSERLFHVEAALRHGATVERLHDATGIDPWFLDQIAQLSEARAELAVTGGPDGLTARDWKAIKRLGFGDGQLAYLWGSTEGAVRAARLATGTAITYKTVDTCAAEFAPRRRTTTARTRTRTRSPGDAPPSSSERTVHRSGRRVRLPLCARGLRFPTPPSRP